MHTSEERWSFLLVVAVFHEGAEDLALHKVGVGRPVVAHYERQEGVLGECHEGHEDDVDHRKTHRPQR